MNLLERLRLLFSTEKEAEQIVDEVRERRLYSSSKVRARSHNRAASDSQGSLVGTNTSAAKGLAGGRLTIDPRFGLFVNANNIILPPESAESDWRLGNLDSKTLSRITPTRLLEMLVDLSPDVSRAVFDFIRLCNPGWELRVYKPGTDQVEPKGQAVADEFFDKLESIYGTVDVLFSRIFMSAFLRGAFLAELVLETNLREGADLIVVDPHTVRFQLTKDPIRGMVPVLVQWQFGNLVKLDRPTIRYIPIDPLPSSPYGRSLASPAVFSTLFLLGLLHDLRRVVSQQGYPRIDLKINMDNLAKQIPDTDASPTKVQEWVNAVVKEVQDVYAKLEPDDAYVHTDVVEVNRPVGTVSADSLGAVGELIRALERMSVRALKTTPFMMGSQDTQTESQANRVWEAHLQNIKSMQHYAETIISKLVDVLIQANGQQGVTKLRFAENRVSEELRDEQTRQLKIANTIQEYNMGWISQDEASQKTVNHKPDQAEPRPQPVSSTFASTADPNAGEKK